MSEHYTEPEKVSARATVIKSAVETLTKHRTHATLCRRSYVREVRNHLIKRGSYDAEIADCLTDDTITRWESFYDSITGTKKASELKVAYLCGPSPENDVRVFCDAGILPENIWAFESDTKTHSKALISALSSEFPFIKIIKGGIDLFLQSSPMRFDIIYLDFCGPLPSRNKKQKTLLAVTRVLASHSLNSPGALITNVSLPSLKGDPKGRELIAKLVACYLYPKNFLEGEPDTTPEGPIAEGYEFDEWLEIVSRDLENYYGQFVTRLMMDNATFVSPYNRYPKHSAIFKNFFKTNNDTKTEGKFQKFFHFHEDYSGGDVITDAGQYPVLWSFAALNKKTNAKDENYPQWVNEDTDFANFANLFLSQLRADGNKEELIKSTTDLTFSMLANNSPEEFLSEALAQVVLNHKLQDYFLFCDVVLAHQLVELLFRQIAVPYHVNTEMTRRWAYQAKEATMFLDMTILDECRYLYDWMPTIEMISNGFSDIERQLSYRFSLDGVSKHRRWYNVEYFFGTAVVDQYTSPFEAKILYPRIQL